MMMLKGCLLVIASVFIMKAHAQVDPGKIDKQVKDSVTRERAAKADREVSRDRSVYDTSLIAPKEKRVKKARRRASCN